MSFSIIIPSYNVERYISDCVCSALNQEYHESFEVIVVDDGSTDQTPKILENLSIKYENLKVFFQENDGAPGKARNRGINESTGDYLLFLDSDDRLPSNTLSIYDQLWRKYDAPSLLVGSRKYIDEVGREISQQALPNLHIGKHDLNQTFDFENKALFVNASGKAFHRSSIDDNHIRFTEGHPGQDTAFSVIFFAYADSYIGTKETVYEVRIREDETNRSLTQQFDPNMVRRRLISAQDCVDQLIDRGLHQYAANSFAYFLMGILSRVIEERKNKKINDQYSEIYKQIFQFKSRNSPIVNLINQDPLRRLFWIARFILSRFWIFKISIFGISFSRSLRDASPKEKDKI